MITPYTHNLYRAHIIHVGYCCVNNRYVRVHTKDLHNNIIIILKQIQLS